MKKGIGRKVRKQRRKSKQKQTEGLADGVKKNLRKLATRLTIYRKYPEELANKKFFCPTCKKAYCISFIDTLTHCKDCYYKNICSKDIQAIKTCNCEGE